MLDCQTLIEIAWLLGAEAESDEKTGTVIITSRVDEIKEPLALRDLLGKLEEQGIKSEIVFDNVKREVYLTKGSTKATIFMPMDSGSDITTAKIVCGKNETEITLVIKRRNLFYK